MESPARRPTLADVALKAGTSTAVVSYVVNGGPRAVAPLTRERVETAIQELGYRRNPIAGALSVGRSNLVGLLVPDTANGFFGELSRCFEAEGRRRGLMTMLGNTGYDDEVSEHYISGFSDLRPRGIFAMSVASGARLPVDTPFLFIHSVPEGVTAPSVRFDDLAGARTVVEHLISHGYTDIHCLAGPHTDDPASLREQGWRQAMETAGLDTAGRIHRSSFDRVVVEGDVRELLGTPPWPRAIFATTDEQALAVLRAATAAGARGHRARRLRRDPRGDPRRRSAHDGARADGAAGRARVRSARQPHRAGAGSCTGSRAGLRARRLRRRAGDRRHLRLPVGQARNGYLTTAEFLLLVPI